MNAVSMPAAGPDSDVRDLDEAIGALGAWLSAGYAYQRRGGDRLELDDQVEIALNEVAWRQDSENAAEEEIERPDAYSLKWAINGLAQNTESGAFGTDIATVHAFLIQEQMT